MKKVLTIGGALVVVLILAVVLYFSLFLNQTIKAGVETLGPKLTQTSISLAEVNISPFSGQGEIKGLVVGNPEGYKTESAIKLGLVRVEIDTGSLLSDRIIIKEVLIDGPEITYEMSLKGSNIAKILANIQSVADSAGGGKSGASDSKDTGGGKKLQINDLRITNGKIKLSAKILQGKAITLPLPDIHLKDIGKEKEGSSVGEVVEKVFAAVTKSTTKAVTGSGELLGKGVKAAGETLNKAGAGIKEGAAKIFGGFKDAFKK